MINYAIVSVSVPNDGFDICDIRDRIVEDLSDYIQGLKVLSAHTAKPIATVYLEFPIWVHENEDEVAICDEFVRRIVGCTTYDIALEEVWNESC